jgi:hypothetical protein
MAIQLFFVVIVEITCKIFSLSTGAKLPQKLSHCLAALPP